MNFRLHALMAAAVLTAAACSVREETGAIEVPQEEVREGFILPSVLTIELEGADTRTTYAYESGRLRTSWADGDAVFASPLANSSRGTVYRVPEGGASTGTFVADAAISTSSSMHAFYHPGDKIHNDASFINFSYKGQVQKKTDPTAHMGRFHAMRKIFMNVASGSRGDFDVSKVSFNGCDQSGCMRFVLSGATFLNPREIRLEVWRNGSLMTNVLRSENLLMSYYSDQSTGEVPVNNGYVQTLTLGLEGYGVETEILAYMMHSNYDMRLPAGCTLRVMVLGDNAFVSEIPVSEAVAIKGGYCSTLSVDSGWKQLQGDYTRYDWDGDVVTLQEGSGGLDLVLMGDGFIKEDFDSGVYDRIMRTCCEDFFSVEPFTTFRNDFSVYYVKAVSPQRLDAVNTGSSGARNSGNITCFSVQFTPSSTTVMGDTERAREYAKKAFTSDADQRVKDATIMVVANQKCLAGTCHYSIAIEKDAPDYGQAPAVSFMALGRTDRDRVELVHHEVNGHGFGKLDDEYYYTSREISSESDWLEKDELFAIGVYRNTDKFVNQSYYELFGGKYELTDKGNVYWSDMFGTVNNYESPSVESLGVFEGAGTYEFGFCRPTEDGRKSIMYQNTGIFNAISRRQILYRIRSLKGEISGRLFGTQEELEYFLQWDAENFLPKMPSMLKSPVTKSILEEPVYLAHPVIEYGTWSDGVFVKR